jgi:hypothetical protein
MTTRDEEEDKEEEEARGHQCDVAVPSKNTHGQ